MSSNASAWAIRNPVPCILLFVVLTGLGLFSFRSLPITYFPLIDVPEVTIAVSDSGVAPSQMETEVTKPIEDAVAALVGVKEIKSTVSEGQSDTTVEFELGIPVDRAVADVENAISAIRSDLPATVDEPVVGRNAIEPESVATYAAIDQTMTAEELSWYVDDVVIRKLSGLPGMGRVERVGGVDREIAVKLDLDRLETFGITAAAITDELKSSNLDVSGGTSRADGRERAITTLATASSVADLAEMPIALPNAPALRLSDLGTVTDATAEQKAFALLEGAPVVTIAIYRARGASDVTVADEVAETLREFAAANDNLSFELIDTSVHRTLGNYDAALHTLIEGAILTVLVVFLFLRDWRATLIAALALPLAAIPTFFVIDLLGFSLNILSLLAITLVTGVLVDDAIVEIENIVRHGQMGKPPFRAALDASDEIGLAVMAISATIIAVFVPVGFMPGMVGRYFSQFGLTVAVAVFFSLLVARLITPVLAAYLMREKAGGHADGQWMRVPYCWLLRHTLRARWLVVIAAFALFGAAVVGLTRLPSGFLPAEDTGKIVASVELPEGSTLDETRRIGAVVSDRLAAVPDVRTVFVQGGADAYGKRDVRRMAVSLDIGRASVRERSLFEIEPLVADELLDVPDIRFEILNDRGGRDVSFSVLGRDGKAASRAADQILSELAETGVARDTTSNGNAHRPILAMQIDPDRAADAGVSARVIAETLRVSTVGASRKDLPIFIDDTRRIPIRLQLADTARDDLATLRALSIPTLSGGSVALSQIADIDFTDEVSIIERLDHERRIDIGFDVPAGISPGEALARVLSLDAVRSLSPEVRVLATGDSDDEGEVFAAFGTSMTAGIAMVLVVLILLFGSALTPLTILVTLPLSICGVVAALSLTGDALSLPVVIGILMLMGIVTKNAIMVVEFAIEREAHGLARREAIIEAASQRLRPILMTTLAMIAGMLPAAIGTGEGGEFRAPMAVAVIGGLAASTVLSLVVVPSLRWLLADLGDVCGRFFRPFLNAETAEGLALPGKARQKGR
ncbi:efflux RND transporter permease subunit [Jiella mangrovi]|uniref:Efflux RND transporter permease subunit n=1 Tax=Jiella mangrovi TaxID=2821407 RepID=A0ABS4BGA8_9HYPH|nr:efflux RND transporter permease subunit [Jiella mangrovi]MBP0615788.1 efflux RND transporter permease subunit [Jiella mangrovi]